MKRFLSLLMVVAMIAISAFAIVGCSEKPEEAGEAKKLNIGITYYAPMNYKDENGVLTGFDTEFAQAVCEKLGYEPNFIVIDWDNKFIELDAGTIDCIWNGMTITDEAKANAAVSNPYVKNAQVVVTKADIAQNYASFEEMKDLTFAAEAGSAGEKCILEAGYACTSLAAQSDALNEVKSGAADACVIDITMANAMTGEGTSYADLAQAMSLNEEEYGIACRQGESLVDDINRVMAEMKADGSLQTLADKYELALA